MGHPTTLLLQDVRCFEGEQHGRLRPITLLVGENSTGKTTFLGCYGTLHRMFSGRPTISATPDFNEEPFAMGSFRDIVRARRGPSGRINEFRLGFALEPDRHSYDHLTATFREQGSQPTISSLRFRFGDDSAFLELQRTEDNGTAFESLGGTIATADFPIDDAALLLDLITMDLPDVSSGTLSRFPHLKPVLQKLRQLHPPTGTDRRRRARIPGSTFTLPHLPELIPVAPLRSKPKRTYDPVRETATPEGEHIPMLMMRLDRTEATRWDSLHEGLVRFGRGAGLFSDIKVKRHGKQMSDPFQLQVKVRSGPHANIMDVGYGISQSLPILVDIMAANGAVRNRAFLLQQPEVHLHPRGQAELASLFISSFKAGRNRFLIETHSDHIVDRVRISVRQGSLRPDDVSILYFEPQGPKGNAVNIHNVHLDEDGNLEKAPPGYRDFFLRETDKLLGFAD